MYKLCREDGYDEEVRYDIINSSNNNPLMSYAYVLRSAPRYALTDDPNIRLLGHECELVTGWFSLGLVR